LGRVSEEDWAWSTRDSTVSITKERKKEEKRTYSDGSNDKRKRISRRLDFARPEVVECCPEEQGEDEEEKGREFDELDVLHPGADVEFENESVVDPTVRPGEEVL
jgi:hypothetical protein